MDRLTNWIEIPVHDLHRAKAFYGAVFQVELVDMPVDGLEYAIFPSKTATNAGALVKGEGYVPSTHGVVLYLDGTGHMDETLERVQRSGGQVLMPTTRLSEEAGDVAFFLDTEGNKIGLQSAVPKPQGPIRDDEMQRILGSAPKRFAFVFKPGPTFGPESMGLQREHARNMLTLLRAGTLHSVTALMDGTDVLGIGVLEASSKAEVHKLLNDDPAVRGGRLVFEVFSAASFGRGDV